MSDETVVVAGYKRVNVIQTGQNSEVWEVVDTNSTDKQRYIMKLLLPEKVDLRGERKLVEHEARVGMALKHPKIIKFHKFSRNRSNPFIVMESFPSMNLKLRLLRGQYDSFIRPKLRSILDQTASALAFMHQKGWVHRDVKPDNVLVNNSGEVRLIDFAIAVRPAGFLSRFLAGKAKTAGTRSYMSPEQIRGQAVDIRSDIYSFGIMTYELASGKLPFIGRTEQDLLHKHLQAPPPPMDPARQVTPEFQSLVSKLLAKKPTERLRTLDLFREELEGIKIFADEVRKPRAARNMS